MMKILSKCEVVLLIFTKCCSFKKGTVVNGQHYLTIVLCQIHMQAVGLRT